VTDGNFLAYSCAAARDFHPLPSSSVLTRLREPNRLEKNKTEQSENLLVLRLESQRPALCLLPCRGRGHRFDGGLYLDLHLGNHRRQPGQPAQRDGGRGQHQ
jgi:hypothetical protein